jgi:hypothetical protein
MATSKKKAQLTLVEKIKNAGISANTYYYRIRVKGMTPEQALKAKKVPTITYKDKAGTVDTASGWAKRLGLTVSAFYARVRKHGPKSAKLFSAPSAKAPAKATKAPAKATKVPAKAAKAAKKAPAKVAKKAPAKVAKKASA